MCDIIVGVLKSTIGVLWDHASLSIAEELAKGEVTDQVFRQLIIKHMVQLKTDLDALARKDLLSSISLLKEGASILGSLECSTDAQEKQQRTPRSCGLTRVVRSFGELRVASEKEFEAAEKCFKDARVEATKAFSNVSFSLEDRVLATKLRITARIMESIHKPRVAGLACESFLKELHEQPAVQQLFTVAIEGGIRSKFRREKRLGITESILLINTVVYNFIRTFTNLTLNIYTWPQIKSYHPLLRADHTAFHNSLVDASDLDLSPFGIVDHTSLAGPVHSTNSKGELIVKLRDQPSFAVVRKSEKKEQSVFTFSEKDSAARLFNINCCATGEDNTMFIISRSLDTDNIIKFKLWIIDANGDIRRQTCLEFLNNVKTEISAVVNRKYITLALRSYKKIYVSNKLGNLKNTLDFSEPKCGRVVSHCITDANDIFVLKQYDENKVAANGYGVIEVFGADDQDLVPKHQIDLPSSHLMKSPVWLCDVKFCFATKTLIATAVSAECGENSRKRPHYLICWPEESRETGIVIPLGDITSTHVYSHAKCTVLSVRLEDRMLLYNIGSDVSFL